MSSANILDEKRMQVWLYNKHFRQLNNKNSLEIINHYIGIYASQPTSWEIILSRNFHIKKTQVLEEEGSNVFIRLPGMRRTKFLMTLLTGEQIFRLTKTTLATHKWRLNDVGLSISDYMRYLPDILETVKNEAKSQRNIAKNLQVESTAIRAMIQVGLYQGDLIRVPSDNEWSNLWKYSEIPRNFETNFFDNKAEKSKFYADIINKYVKNYGPVSTKDFAWWFNISIKKARDLLRESSAKEFFTDYWLSENDISEFNKFAISESNAIVDNEVRFLPAWDPLLMGYAPESIARLSMGLTGAFAYDQHGNGNPVIMVGANCVGSWSVKKFGKHRQLVLNIDDVGISKKKLIVLAATKWALRIGVDFKY